MLSDGCGKDAYTTKSKKSFPNQIELMNSKGDDLFIFAGEKSGDLHGGHLLNALKNRCPSLEVAGVGGPRMRQHGIKSLLHTEDFEVIGFTDVILSLPKLIKQFLHVRNHILKTQPKVVLLIDYPGFNLRMAKALRRKGYQGKIVHYISPTVWAWGKKRVFQMAKTLDALLTIFPFEAECYSQTSLDVQFVGNPIKEYLSKYSYDDQWKQKNGIPSTDQLISLFPGSRTKEINNLPLQLEAAALLKKDFPEAIFAISCAHSNTASCVREILKKGPLKLNRDAFLVPKEHAYEMMRDSRCAIAKSGTVTLELALHGRPTVVMYQVSAANRFLIKYLVRPNVSHFCLVNILAGKEVFPELIAQGLSSQNIYEQIKKLNGESKERQLCVEECRKVQRSLIIDNTSERAAAAVEKFLSC